MGIWRDKNRNQQKEIRFQKEYQISVAEWQLFYDFQKGLCGFCHKPISGFFDRDGKTALDHCHRTGLIRGLLHRWPCNRLLGILHDDPILCRFAADYLEHPPATAALGAARYTVPGQVGTKKRRKLLKKLKQQNKS